MPTYALTEEGIERLEDLRRRESKEPISINQEVQYSLLDNLSDGPQDLYPQGRRKQVVIKMLESHGYIEKIGDKWDPFNM